MFARVVRDVKLRGPFVPNQRSSDERYLFDVKVHSSSVALVAGCGKIGGIWSIDVKNEFIATRNVSGERF